MRLPIYDLTHHEMLASGNYAWYYRISKRRGLKVLQDESYETLADLRKYGMHEARKEFKLLKECACSIVPKVYSLAYVFINDDQAGFWYPAIVLEHVEGKELCEYSTKFSGRMVTKIDSEFERLTGYTHGDLHTGNIIYNSKTKRYKVIDFSPAHIWLSEHLE